MRSVARARRAARRDDAIARLFERIIDEARRIERRCRRRVERPYEAGKVEIGPWLS